MSKNSTDIKSKLENFEFDVAPSAVELKRFNNSLDMLPKRGFNRKHLLWLLLLLFALSNIWFIYQNQMLHKQIKTEQSEITTSQFSSLENKRKINSQNRVRIVTDSLISVFELKNKTSELETENSLSLSKSDFLAMQNEITKLRQAVIASNKKLEEKASFAGNNSSEEFTYKTVKEERNNNTNLFARNTEKLGSTTDGLGFNTTKTLANASKLIVDSAKTDSLEETLLAKKEKEIDKSKGAEKTEQIKLPIEKSKHIGLGIGTAYLNTYFVNGQMPIRIMAFVGFDYGKIGFNAGFSYQHLSYRDISVNNLHAEIDQINGVPDHIASSAKELYANAYSLLLPIDLCYRFAKNNNNPYLRIASSLHLYSLQKFKIEAEYEDFFISKTHPEIQFFNYQIGLGSAYQIAKQFVLKYEGGLTLGNPRFDYLLRERQGIYVQARILYKL